MTHPERSRKAPLFVVAAAVCLFITGCLDYPKPEDVECYDLSGLIPKEEPVTCKDGNAPQLCTDPDSVNCGYYVNGSYIPCRSCNDCAGATRVAVALCLGIPRAGDLSYTDLPADNPIEEHGGALRMAQGSLSETY